MEEADEDVIYLNLLSFPRVQFCFSLPVAVVVCGCVSLGVLKDPSGRQAIDFVRRSVRYGCFLFFILLHLV